jgi:hypothetical protein
MKYEKVSIRRFVLQLASGDRLWVGVNAETIFTFTAPRGEAAEVVVEVEVRHKREL